MIQCEPKTDWREKKQEVYKKAYERLCKRLPQENFDYILTKKREEIQKFIFLYFKARKKSDINSMDLKAAEQEFQFQDIMIQLIGVLKPKELEEIFPIDKWYKGDKYQSKDYFFTRDKMNRLQEDKPIRESIEPIELLCDYMNHDISSFIVDNMVLISKIQRLKGEPTLHEYLSKELGLKSYIRYENGVYLDTETGKTVKIQIQKRNVRKPKFINVVK